MDKDAAVTIFESLASPMRLEIYRLLVRQGPEGLVAGEIASTLNVAPTKLSFHLKALAQARLVTAVQEGRFQRYRPNIPVMLDTIAYLTEECCSGRIEQCADLGAVSCCVEGAPAPIDPKSGK